MSTRTVTIKPSGGNYTSLAAAVAAEGHDLTTDNGSGSAGILIFEISGNWSGAPDTTQVDFDGYTTSATYYIKVTTDSANRPTGKWDTTRYILSITDANPFIVRENYIWIDAIQVTIVSATAKRAWFQNVGRNTGWIRLSNSIIKGHNGANQIVLSIVTTGTFTDLLMWNCISYNWGSNGDSYLDCTEAGATWNIYNSTFIWPATTTAGIRQEGGTLNCLNVYSGGNTAGRDFFGTITKTTTASSDTTGDVDNITINTTNFTNVSAGTEDFRLPSGSGLIGVGTDDPGSGLYSNDIDGSARTSTWDIGADEYVAAGGLSIPVAMAHYRRMRGN